MDSATQLIWILAALWVLAILIAVVRAWRTRLAPLTRKARDRYELAWERIEARFLYAPQEAVREADGLVMTVLRDRHQSTHYDELPRRAKRARRKSDARLSPRDRRHGRTQAPAACARGPPPAGLARKKN
jgi:hypothetical protein